MTFGILYKRHLAQPQCLHQKSDFGQVKRWVIQTKVIDTARKVKIHVYIMKHSFYIWVSECEMVCNCNVIDKINQGNELQGA